MSLPSPPPRLMEQQCVCADIICSLAVYGTSSIVFLRSSDDAMLLVVVMEA